MFKDIRNYKRVTYVTSIKQISLFILLLTASDTARVPGWIMFLICLIYNIKYITGGIQYILKINLDICERSTNGDTFIGLIYPYRYFYI